MALKVAILTGTRADWGLLSEPAKALRADSAFDVHVIATGSHLSAAFGMTVNEIEHAGFPVHHRVPILEESDDAAATTRALGRTVSGLADVFAELEPDLVLLLGDRYEILGGAQAALIARIPVAHLCGGDLTEGALDDSIRHAITKLSHIHFVTNDVAGRRVAQLGEDPSNIHVTGSPGLDAIRSLELLDQERVFERLKLTERGRLALVTFHPPTLDESSTAEQMTELLAALDQIGDDFTIIVTGSNADTDGRVVTLLGEEFAASRDHVAFRLSLGHHLYLSAMAAADVVIGNSSSGLYEAPSFAIPTVNIGDRQEGRLKAKSVIDCAPRRADIVAAVSRAQALDCKGVINPYGDGYSSDRIVNILKDVRDPRSLLKKKFCDVRG